MPKRTTSRLTKRAVESLSRDSFAWDSEVPGFGARCTPAGARSFVVQFRTESGKQRRLVVGNYPTLTVDEARALAREKLRVVEAGGDPSDDRRARRDAMSVEQLAESYLGHYARDRNLKLQTVKDARQVLRKHAMGPLGTVKVVDVRRADIRRVHGEARAASGVYQANRLLAVLSRMFSLAIEDELRTDNPCKGVKKFPEDQRTRNLSDEEVGRLLRACAEYEHRDAANAVQLLLFTGARLQEVLKAPWSQFDLTSGLWVKPSAHTKTKKQHVIRLPGSTLDLLRSMRARNPTGKFLIPGASKDRPRADLKRPWAAIARLASLDNVRLHDLRRTTASFMFSTGSDLGTVGMQLGHTQSSTTQRYAFLKAGVQHEGSTRALEKMLAAL